MSETQENNRGLMKPMKFANAIGMHYNTVRNMARKGQIKVKWFPNSRFKVYESEVERINNLTGPEPKTN